MRTGRPLKYEDHEKLKADIRAYFDACFEEKWFDELRRDEAGNVMYDNLSKIPLKQPLKKKVQIRPVTITGLAVALGTSRKTIIDYEGKEDFSNTIKEAKDFIENCLEDGMIKGDINATVGIFNAKNNFDWVDKTEVEQDVKMNFKIDSSTPTEELEKLIK